MSSDQTDGEIYRTPGRGEDHLPQNLPLGWIADAVEVPEGWEVKFAEQGACLRFRRRVDRETYGVWPPGWPGVGITSGSDYWAVIGDTNRVLVDEWFDPDDDPDAVAGGVEGAIAEVEQDLERCRLERVLDGVVPSSVIRRLIDRFETFERVAEIEEDTPVLESVDGIGPARREAIQQRFTLYHMQSGDRTEVVTHVQ